ncbi:hypothetical protein [Specibacter cremeus]|uniref:hypothetical protein n=1 Tax=Specibacter cremeus TaxID=1629051 RepID=UPI000F79ABB6|nr:hypothetical protein [Specibacter cremeus]
MSNHSAPKRFIVKAVDRVSPGTAAALRAGATLPEEVAELRGRLEAAERGLAELRATVDVLNRDLDESRRLNLRAAELMDVAFTELVR